MAQEASLLKSYFSALMDLVTKLILLKVNMIVTKAKICDMMKAEVEAAAKKYKDDLQNLVNEQIDKISGGNREVQETLKKLVDDVFKNLDNPQKMKEELIQTVETNMTEMIKSICKKQYEQLEAEKDRQMQEYQAQIEQERAKMEAEFRAQIEQEKELLREQAEELIEEKKRELLEWMKEKLKE